MVYTVTFNPALDYIIKIENFEIGKINRNNQKLYYQEVKGLMFQLFKFFRHLKQQLQDLLQVLQEIN